MVRRANDDRINLFQVEELSIILELLGLLSNLLRREIKVGLIEIANGDYFGVGVLQKRIQHLVSTVAQSDKAEPHAVVGADGAQLAQGQRGARGGDRFGEMSPGEWVHNDP